MEEKFKATFTIVRPVKVKVKTGFFKFEEKEVQETSQFTIGGLDKEQSERIQDQFVMSVVGAMAGGAVQHVKVEAE